MTAHSFKLYGFILLNFLFAMPYLSVKAQSVQAHGDEAGNPQPKLEIKSFDWKGQIAPNRLVVIKNPYGSIRSRNNSEQKVFVHATYQLIGDTPLQPEFRTLELDNQTLIEVDYPQNIRDEKGQLRGRTDISVLFPSDVSVFAETRDGLIKIDKSESHVEAHTHSGEISLTTTGLFSVSSQSGKISLKLRGQKQAGESFASTKSGSIKAEIFKDMSLHLTANTSAELTLNDKIQDQALIISQAGNLSKVALVSQQGQIAVQLVDPPALTHSIIPSSMAPSNVTSVDIDLRDVKKARPWQPGDPIFDRDDKRDNSTSEAKKKSAIGSE